MTDTAALAILTDGSRIPLSDPLDEARRHWRDGEYDSDVVGIEMDSGETGDHAAIPEMIERTQARLEGL